MKKEFPNKKILLKQFPRTGNYYLEIYEYDTDKKPTVIIDMENFANMHLDSMLKIKENN